MTSKKAYPKPVPLPLFQEGSRGWDNPQPNLDVSRCRVHSKNPTTRKRLIESFRVPASVLDAIPINSEKPWQGYIIQHKAHGQWKIYGEIEL